MGSTRSIRATGAGARRCSRCPSVGRSSASRCRARPFSTWSLAKLADFLVAEGVVEDISHEELRALLREEGVSFQRLKTFKESNDPAYDLSRDRLYGHIKTRKGRTEFLAFCRYIRSLYPPDVRLAFVLDNFSPHLTTKTDSRVGDWAADSNVELAYVPFCASWLNRIEAQFTGLRYFALDGTDHPDHGTQGRMIRRYIAWRNRNAHDRHLRRLVDRANVA
jgi:transposase